MMSERSRAYRTGEKRRARVARNHSLICEGLPDVLVVMQREEAIKTIVPGRVFRAKASREHFSLRVASETGQGWRLTARLGQTVQEVFVVTDLSHDDMQAASDRAVDEGVHGKRLARLRRRELDSLAAAADLADLEGDDAAAAAMLRRAKDVRVGAWSPSGGRVHRGRSPPRRDEPQPDEAPAAGPADVRG